MQKGKKIITKTLDALSILLPSPKKKISLDEVKRVLVLNCGVFGDTLLSFPAISSLRDRFPKAHLSMVVNPAFRELWKYNEDYDELIFYSAPWLAYHHPIKLKDYREWRILVKKIKGYDLVIDLRGDIRSLLFLLYPAKAPLRAGHFYSGGKHLLNLGISYPQKHEVENQLAIIKHLGGKSKPYTYPPGDEERTHILKLLPERKKKRILLFVSPGYPEKAWQAEKWADLSRELEKSFDIIFAGGPNDQYVPKILESFKGKYIDFSGKLTLNELAALIEQVDLVVGVDTGPMHLSAAVGKRSIALFGPTDPERWKPYQNCVIIRRENLNELRVEEVKKMVRKQMGELG